MTETKKRRGFAVMSEKEKRRISSLGGEAAHRKGTAHVWTSETAREAGRKGGLAKSANKSKDAVTE